jgi:general secretion pathway protein A
VYLSYWGLRESPFRGTLDPRWFYQSATHEEALARLNFLVDERRRMGLLLGEPGIGKSLLLEYFARSLRRAGCQTILTSIVGASAHEMLWTLASQLGAAPSSSATLFTL